MINKRTKFDFMTHLIYETQRIGGGFGGKKL
jgi:hypothetical protein